MIIILISLSFQIITHAQTNSIEIRMHKKAYYDVFAYLKNGDTINLTQFKPWTKLTDLKIT